MEARIEKRKHAIAKRGPPVTEEAEVEAEKGPQKEKKGKKGRKVRML